MRSGFNTLAPYYDRLARLIFRRSIQDSQAHFFGHVQNGDAVLVIGGGAGAFLPTLLRERKDLRIDFIEQSEAMIRRAKKAVGNSGNVNFIHVDFFDFVPDRYYNVVLLPFFLDMFLLPEIEKTIRIIDEVSTRNTRLVVTEFNDPENPWGWRGLIMKAMYLFFRFTCGIAAKQMPDWKTIFLKFRWELEEEATYFYGMLGSFLFLRR